MVKPDWAERLQRTFTRKYDAGFAMGLTIGKAVGGQDERDRVVKILKNRIEAMCDCYECVATREVLNDVLEINKPL